MRKMKSRLVLVKVWYEPHINGALVDQFVQDSICKGWPAARKDWVHSVEVNDGTLQAQHPKPDF